jgi:hypothetical protein
VGNKNFFGPGAQFGATRVIQGYFGNKGSAGFFTLKTAKTLQNG